MDKRLSNSNIDSEEHSIMQDKAPFPRVLLSANGHNLTKRLSKTRKLDK
jgi:hypothetical protein